MSERHAHEELFELLGALCNESMSAEQHERLQQILEDDSEARDLYRDYLDLHLGLAQLHPTQEALPGIPGFPDGTSARPSTEVSWSSRRMTRYVGAIAAVVCLVAIAVMIAQRVSNDEPGVAGGGDGKRPVSAPVFATVIQTAGTRFSIESGLIGVGSQLKTNEEYALLEGVLQLEFQRGAVTTIEGPAVFRIADDDRMLLKFGKCSVYAPDGAQGFVVETPLSKVVDLGTRFSVDVDESGETDLHVVEGAAEVSSRQPTTDEAGAAVRLVQGESRRYAFDGGVIRREIPFDETGFTRQLPDRVISYEAMGRSAAGGVENLTSVTVQRAGQSYRYDANELIGIRLLHYKGTDGLAFMALAHGTTDPFEDGDDATSRRDLLEGDRNLSTGLINPGGAPSPLRQVAIMNDPENADQPNTPGMAFRFVTPVSNGPGPDVVLFDLHLIVQSDAGDPFHVSPLEFAGGLHSHTIRKFDIRLSSREAKKLDGFRLFKFDAIANSIGELDRMGHNGGVENVVNSKVLAVGIDLSDLGYHPGEMVSGLFLQDALDDKNYIDPVFIAGLPPVEDRADVKRDND